MSVTDAFLQWYQQLPPNDKQSLCDFLRHWLHQSNLRPATPAPRFGGRNSGPVNASTHGPTQLTCPKCGTDILIK